MSFQAPKQACVFALYLLFGCASVSSAHALPGSTLTFSRSDHILLLSIRVPLEDLALASTDFDGLQSASLDDSLSADDIGHLARYFADHLILERDAARIPLTVEQATLQLARNEHVGTYRELTLSMTSHARSAHTLSMTDFLSMTLTYDALMHEIRNHRATVRWVPPDSDPVILARFGYRPIDGVQQPVRLALPAK